MITEARARRMAPLETHSITAEMSVRDLSAGLTALLADVFAIFVKTKNFHWHIPGLHFHDYYLMLEEQGEQIFGIADPMAERVRKMGGTTVRSISQTGRLQRILDNNADSVTPAGMLAELRDDNRQLVKATRQLHNLCDIAGDLATASLIEVWIDEAECRAWFFFKSTRCELTNG